MNRLSEPELLIRAVSGKEITQILLNGEDIADQVKGGIYTLIPVYENMTLTVVTRDAPEVQSKTYTVQSVGGHGGNHGPVDFVVEIRSDKRLAKWKMIALILFVIIMMGAAYCIGYYRVLTPNANQAAQPEVTEAKTVKPQTHNTAATTNQVETKKAAEKDSTAKADKAQTTQAQQKSTAGKPEQVQTKHEQAQPQPAQPRYHIVKSGENLNGIAKKVYGSKSYASLIIKANHIKNPDLVDVGTKLILPEVNDKQQ